MRTSNLEYTSFLVRLWREPSDVIEPPATNHKRLDDACPEQLDPTHCELRRRAHQEWFAQVEHIPTGERQYFASLEDLFAFIRAQVAGPPAGKGTGEQENRSA